MRNNTGSFTEVPCHETYKWSSEKIPREDYSDWIRTFPSCCGKLVVQLSVMDFCDRMARPDTWMGLSYSGSHCYQ